MARRWSERSHRISSGVFDNAHFCTSGEISNDKKRYSPLGLNFNSKLQLEANANGRARYWLEGGKCLGKATKVRVDHTFALPFGGFQNFDDTESALDYRLDQGSYHRLPARRQLSLTEIHRFTPTSRLRQGGSRSIQDLGIDSSPAFNHGQANGDRTEVQDAGRGLLEQALGYNDGHFLEKIGDFSDGNDSCYESGSDISDDSPLPSGGSRTPPPESVLSKFNRPPTGPADVKTANNSVAMVRISPALPPPAVATPATDLEEP
ncbi:hypothetical protein BDZ45DRAFT_804548 [Acephala macrosclerotiorum]|nr:hypothetical protein BDZ45DRAFT_804548 [Acephala macrosclerotiorum]